VCVQCAAESANPETVPCAPRKYIDAFFEPVTDEENELSTK